jgi:hypothetical protein
VAGSEAEVGIDDVEVVAREDVVIRERLRIGGMRERLAKTCTSPRRGVERAVKPRPARIVGRSSESVEQFMVNRVLEENVDISSRRRLSPSSVRTGGWGFLGTSGRKHARLSPCR